MNPNYLMAGTGVLLMILAFTMTGISYRPMAWPVKQFHPPTNLARVLFFVFGAIMFVLAVVRLSKGDFR